MNETGLEAISVSHRILSYCRVFTMNQWAKAFIALSVISLPRLLLTKGKVLQDAIFARFLRSLSVRVRRPSSLLGKL